jgi:hypothetical protein
MIHHANFAFLLEIIRLNHLTHGSMFSFRANFDPWNLLFNDVNSWPPFSNRPSLMEGPPEPEPRLKFLVFDEFTHYWSYRRRSQFPTSDTRTLSFIYRRPNHSWGLFFVHRPSRNGKSENYPDYFMTLSPIAGAKCAVRLNSVSISTGNVSFFQKSKSVQFTQSFPVLFGRSRVSVATSPSGMQMAMLTTTGPLSGLVDFRLASFVSVHERHLAFSFGLSGFAFGALWSSSPAPMPQPRGLAFSWKRLAQTVAFGTVSSEDTRGDRCVFFRYHDARDPSSQMTSELYMHTRPDAPIPKFTYAQSAYAAPINFVFALTLGQSVLVSTRIVCKSLRGITCAAALALDSHKWEVSFSPLLSFETGNPTEETSNTSKAKGN